MANKEVQNVKIVSSVRNKWTTVLRNALTGGNAIRDIEKAIKAEGATIDQDTQRVIDAFALVESIAIEKRQALL